MEVTALCIRLLRDANVRIIPTGLQVFEYESVSFTCEGFDVSAGWKVRNTKKVIPNCSVGEGASTVTCTLEYSYKSDSGEYWCEDGGGERSNTVNIIVTDVSVILGSPVLPVMEGEDVTLYCRKKMTSSSLKADFYKNGLLIAGSSTVEMTIHNISKSHEGLYKCHFSDAGESPESWLAVRVANTAVRIVPTRLQVLEYQSVSFTCEGFDFLAGWKVRNAKKFLSDCSVDTVTLTVTCTIQYAYKSDSGEYWCEGQGGKRSNNVSITVTDGPVMLTSTVLPAMDGDSVTPCCGNDTTSVKPSTNSYEDFLSIITSSTGETTVHSVSTSDEGLYQSNNSDIGQLPESCPPVKDAARIVPTGFQVFEYESVSFTCEGLNVSAGWKVRSIKKFVSQCSVGAVMSTVTCTIDYAYKSDSGEYWCEGDGGEMSNAVNITITDSSVILETPVCPVTEGEALSLHCKNKNTSSSLPADFYKDGLLIGSSATGGITIHSMSKSDEGLYKCHISGAGESPESWLAVRDYPVILEIPVLPVMEWDSVTLRCRNKLPSASIRADFYKDGILIASSSTGEMTIYIVSKCDEGLYKCRMSGAGLSPESWLAVRDRPSSDRLFYVLLLVRTVFTILIVAVLLPVVGLLHYGKLRLT